MSTDSNSQPRRLITYHPPVEPDHDPVGSIVPGVFNEDGSPYRYSIQDAINEAIGEDESSPRELFVFSELSVKPAAPSQPVAASARAPRFQINRSDICMLARIGLGGYVAYLPCRDRVEEKSFLKLVHARVIVGKPGCYTIDENRVSPRQIMKINLLRKLCILLDLLSWGNLPIWEPLPLLSQPIYVRGPEGEIKVTEHKAPDPVPAPESPELRDLPDPDESEFDSEREAEARAEQRAADYLYGFDR